MIYIMEILITSCQVRLPDCTREMISVITLYTKVTNLGVPPILRQANMGMIKTFDSILISLPELAERSGSYCLSIFCDLQM